MSRFVRPAGWLRQLFTSSQTGPVNPDIVSDDVSLNQPYDGGGYPLMDNSGWLVKVTSATAAAANTTLRLPTGEEIVRIMAVSAHVTAGVAPTAMVKINSNISGNPGVIITNRLTLDSIRQGFQVYCPIGGPAHEIIGRHQGGDAATIVEWGFYAVTAPLGSVFYV